MRHRTGAALKVPFVIIADEAYPSIEEGILI
jgi:hypothetical protein